MEENETIKFPPKLKFLFRDKMPDGITPIRNKVAYGGRGSSKSWSVARALLLMGSSPIPNCPYPLRCLCARQLQNSIDESVHRLLEEQIYKMGLSSRYTIKKSYILGPDGTEFFFEGIQHNTSKIKSYEGVDVCWVEEANAVTESSWKILTPSIRKEQRDGFGNITSKAQIWITFNPELESDYTFQRFVKNPAQDTWVEHVNWRDNPWFPEVLMAEMLEMRNKDYDGYLNIWEGQCRQMLDGVVYRNELINAQRESRIGKFMYDHSKPVDTFWDIGYSDMTAIWFVQRVGTEYRILRFYQNSSKTLAHYAQKLRNFGYSYKTHHLPHDAGNKNAAALATGKTIAQALRDFELGEVKVLPRLKISDGINAARSMFPQCSFDENNCSEGLECLRHYRYDVDPDSKLLSREPLHDQYSHAADAFRYFAIGSKEKREMRGAQRLNMDGKKIRLRLGIGDEKKSGMFSWMVG